jgi:bifunctional non-homologous end joining protein LigD
MLATLTKSSFDDPAWGFEPKWDGVRALAVCDTSTRLFSRNGKDMTEGYPELAGLHDRLVALDAVLDGEIVAFQDGKPSFQLLQQRMHVREPRRVEALAKRIPVVFMAFDLIYLDGKSLTAEPLRERRAALEEILVPDEHVQLSPLVEGAGVALYRAAEEQGLEGIVAKRLDSRYEPGARSRSWLKVKLTYDADVVIVGWTEGEGRRAGSIGSLVMAVYDSDGLRYVGNVGTGFDRAGLDDAQGRHEQPFGQERHGVCDQVAHRGHVEGLQCPEPHEHHGQRDPQHHRAKTPGHFQGTVQNRVLGCVISNTSGLHVHPPLSTSRSRQRMERSSRSRLPGADSGLPPRAHPGGSRVRRGV